MIITYYGVSCFKIQSGDRVLAINPPSKRSDFKSPRFQADIVFVSTDHKDYNGFDNIAGKNKEPFLVEGPGEYEIDGMYISGVDSGDGNSVYVLNFEDLNLCHFGVFGGGELNSESREAVADVDILFISPFKDAKKVINQISPKIIIPMSHDKKELSAFLKEFGQDVKPVEKLTLKKKDILGKKTEVIVLKPLLN
ncbi:MBL fold metallo-hydrolase [Patescibacteria group bacterium]